MRTSDVKRSLAKFDGEDESQTLSRILSRDLVPAARDDLVHCFKLSQRMHGVEIVQEASRQRLFCLRISDAELKEEHMLHRRPLYARTRRVQAVEKVIQGHTVVVLICSCGRFKRMVCACCEHVLALLQREPTKDDVFPRSLKMYELKYAEDFEIH